MPLRGNPTTGAKVIYVPFKYLFQLAGERGPSIHCSAHGRRPKVEGVIQKEDENHGIAYCHGNNTFSHSGHWITKRLEQERTK